MLGSDLGHPQRSPIRPWDVRKVLQRRPLYVRVTVGSDKTGHVDLEHMFFCSGLRDVAVRPRVSLARPRAGAICAT